MLVFDADGESVTGMEFEDGIPVVAEDTTYNIHGGRDVFAKQSPLKSAAKPAVPRKPSLEKINSIRRQLSQHTE